MSKSILGLPLIEFDLNFESSLVGVDEVGRGCLAGPVFAGATHFNDLKNLDFDWLSLVDDSKKLSEKKRESLCEELKKTAIWGVGFSSVDEINEFGILPATFLAMKRAIQQIEEQVGKKDFFTLVDGISKIKDLTYKQRTIKKGDSTSFHIAAASIIAKTERDNYMKELSEEFNEYNWERNVGYGTLKHRQAIIKYGSTKHHRTKFLRKLKEEQVQTSLFI